MELILYATLKCVNGAESEGAECVCLLDLSFQTLPDPVEKQFTLRLAGKTINKGMGSPQFMRYV